MFLQYSQVVLKRKPAVWYFAEGYNSKGKPNVLFKPSQASRTSVENNNIRPGDSILLCFDDGDGD